MKKGLLVVNLGTPQAPQPEEVGKYLKQFLMDPYVIDIPWFLRWILVNILIVPKRSHTSAEAYQQVWTDRGSPLMYHSLDLTEKLKKELSNYQVELAMRYGEPSIEQALKNMQGLDEITIIPLYPQYALASTETTLQEAFASIERLNIKSKIKFVSYFYDNKNYLKSQTEIIKEHYNNFKADYLLFSYHGLPERHLYKACGKDHCLKKDNCCDKIEQKNLLCYRAHCVHNTKAIARDLNLTDDQYAISFQSRLGRTPWIQPNTEEMYEVLIHRGVRRLAVVCPSFVADCLETLEEVAIRGRDKFKSLGGDDLHLIPCVNSSDSWVKALAQIALEAR